MKQANRQRGRKGEDTAAEFVEKLGWEIILRNFNTRFGEIDMICKDKNELVFVEVKSKNGLNFGSPEEMFTRTKYQQVKRMAGLYLHGREVPCRIDLITVLFNSLSTQIHHYPGVVLD